MMIEEYITDICELLKINKPYVSYDISHFQSNTMMAQCESSGNVIYLRKKAKPDPDYMFAIAHELRHIWQLQNDEQFYFSTYKPVNLCDNIESYNLQMAEVDANAFAGIVMVEFFQLQPLFNGLSDSVKTRIRERIDEIVPTLQPE